MKNSSIVDWQKLVVTELPELLGSVCSWPSILKYTAAGLVAKEVLVDLNALAEAAQQGQLPQLVTRMEADYPGLMGPLINLVQAYRAGNLSLCGFFFSIVPALGEVIARVPGLVAHFPFLLVLKPLLRCQTFIQQLGQLPAPNLNQNQNLAPVQGQQQQQQVPAPRQQQVPAPQQPFVGPPAQQQQQVPVLQQPFVGRGRGQGQQMGAMPGGAAGGGAMGGGAAFHVKQERGRGRGAQ